MARTPYTNFHDLNLNWIIEKIKTVFTPDNPPPYPVTSVNQQTGDVNLKATDIPVSANDPQNIASALASKYVKPASGIPASDLAPGVIPDPASVIDDTAGYGVYNKTWSAHKLFQQEADILDLEIDKQDKPANYGSAGQVLGLNAQLQPEWVNMPQADLVQAVDDWLQDNISNPANPPLDRSLSLENACAPADMVGDLKDELYAIIPAVANGIDPSKNLLFISPEFLNKDFNGITISRSEDGESYIVNGTSSTSVRIPVNTLLYFNKFPITGNYTFSFSELKRFSTTARISLRYSYVLGDNTTNIINQNSAGRIATVEFTSEPYLQLLFNADDVYNNATFKLQIEQGTLSTTYQKPAGLIDYEVRQVIPSIDQSKIINDSFKMEFERFENVQYIDIISNASTFIGMDSGAISLDRKIHFRHNPYSFKCITNPNESYTRFRLPQISSIPMLGTQEIDIYLYTESASVISRVRLYGVSTGYSRNIDTINNGWNKLRFVTEGASLGDDFSTKFETEWRIYVYSSADATVWLGDITAVKPDKATLIITDDGPYKTFFNIAYPALYNIGVPVTWAGDWGKIGLTDKIITQSDLNALTYDGLSEFSFHNFDGTIQENGTALTALNDTVNNIRYLQAHGLQPEKIWRAAWQGNNCAHPELANELVEASASYNGSTGIVQFPFFDRFNIPRWAMQNRSTDTIDEWFNKLKNQHSMLMMYTHGISDADTDVSETLLEYYITKIQEGINAGWLNVTTFSRMMNHYRKLEV